MNANQNVNMLTNNESSVTSISVLSYGMGVIQTAVVTQALIESNTDLVTVLLQDE